MSSPQEPNQQGSPEAGLTPPPPLHPSPSVPSPGPEGSYVPPPYGQDAPPPPFGLPGQTPEPKSRKGLYIVLGIVGAGVILVAAGAWVLVSLAGGPTGEAKELAEDFTELVISGQSDKAYDFLDPALQDQLPQEDFVAGIASLDMDDSCSTDYHQVSAGAENGTKSADIAGVITCDNTTVELAYRFEGADQLKMVDIKLTPPPE